MSTKNALIPLSYDLVTTDAVVVMDGLYYQVIVAYSLVLQRKVFKVINKKWDVEAFEISNEKMALYLCSMLDKTYNKPMEDTIMNSDDAEVLEHFVQDGTTVLN